LFEAYTSESKSQADSRRDFFHLEIMLLRAPLARSFRVVTNTPARRLRRFRTALCQICTSDDDERTAIDPFVSSWNLRFHGKYLTGFHSNVHYEAGSQTLLGNSDGLARV
jgi:hypothetical protein